MTTNECPSFCRDRLWRHPALRHAAQLNCSFPLCCKLSECWLYRCRLLVISKKIKIKTSLNCGRYNHTQQTISLTLASRRAILQCLLDRPASQPAYVYVYEPGNMAKTYATNFVLPTSNNNKLKKTSNIFFILVNSVF